VYVTFFFVCLFYDYPADKLIKRLLCNCELG